MKMEQRKSACIFAASALAALLFACSSGYNEIEGSAAVRPAGWAAPVLIRGAPNCYKVSDFLYRGAQPNREGFLELKNMGVKTIINLREFNSDTKLLEGTDLKYFHIPSDITRPVKKDYQKVLDIAGNPEFQPVFIHCYYGADRTGTAVALYRIIAQRWDTGEAIRELQQGGYGFHSIYREIVIFIRDFNGRP
jgi:tyrosine-protein phosphatase SIW14